MARDCRFEKSFLSTAVIVSCRAQKDIDLHSHMEGGSENSKEHTLQKTRTLIVWQSGCFPLAALSGRLALLFVYLQWCGLWRGWPWTPVQRAGSFPAGACGLDGVSCLPSSHPQHLLSGSVFWGDSVTRLHQTYRMRTPSILNFTPLKSFVLLSLVSVHAWHDRVMCRSLYRVWHKWAGSVPASSC